MNHSESESTESFEHQLTIVFELHEQGNFKDAESLYCKLIDQFPSIWQLHFNYGLLLFETGRFAESVEAYQQGLTLDADNPDLLFNLALCKKNLGVYEEAIHAYRKVLSQYPDDLDCLYNLAGCYRVMGEDMIAIQWYEKTLQLNKNHLSALNNLAYLYHKNDHPRQAAVLYRHILELDPGHQRADHMLASIEGKSRQNAPDSYIRDVFDQFSDHYESSLVDKLEYRLPTAMLQFMQRTRDGLYASPRFGRLLDLGCGTGLAGEVLKPYCDSMTGVDISEKMVAVAEHKSIYSALHVAEILTFLATAEPAGSAGFDCIVAADVFPYIGDLKKLFIQAAGVTSYQGCFFFSVEALQDENKSFHLLPTGRFAHTLAYIEELAADTGWNVTSSEEINLRREKDGWITGFMFALIKR